MAFSMNSRKRTAMSEINVTPLVDVMLVLLIIFMVTAPMMQEGVKLDLPKAQADPLVKQTNVEAIVISVTKKGRSTSMTRKYFSTTSSGRSTRSGRKIPLEKSMYEATSQRCSVSLHRSWLI
jgi:biopolymer transport protein ExbD